MKKWLIAGAGAAGLLISSVALARVDVGISIGVPGGIPGAGLRRARARLCGAGAGLRPPPPSTTVRRPSTWRPRWSIRPRSISAAAATGVRMATGAAPIAATITAAAAGTVDAAGFPAHRNKYKGHSCEWPFSTG